ncbi:MAG TPA: hypothetical protein VI915_05300 [Thermoplasmata archaeon]|nr:hypothetical protein [Thermoplasmata archaeon]
MKNALFYGLLVLVAVILGLLAYGIYLSVTHDSGVDVVTATCTGFVLIGSLLAWELLMKPGFWRKPGREKEPDREPAPPAEPPRARKERRSP